MKTKYHKPNAVRMILIVLGAIPAALVALQLTPDALNFSNPSDSRVLGLALYFVMVTMFDSLALWAFHIKSSRFCCDETLLMENEHVTPDQLDTYYRSRTIIRLISVGVSIAVGLTFFLLNKKFPVAFCITYFVSTLIGILFVRFKTSIVIPALVKIVENPRAFEGRSIGSISPSQYAMNYSLNGGSGGPFPTGPVKF